MRAGQRKGPGTPAGALRRKKQQAKHSPSGVPVQAESCKGIEVALTRLRETLWNADPAAVNQFYHWTVRVWGRRPFLSYEFERFVSRAAIDQKGGARW